MYNHCVNGSEREHWHSRLAGSVQQAISIFCDVQRTTGRQDEKRNVYYDRGRVAVALTGERPTARNGFVVASTPSRVLDDIIGAGRRLTWVAVRPKIATETGLCLLPLCS